MQPVSTLVSARARRALLGCALAGSLAVGLSACGSSGSSAAASSGSSTTSSSARYTARLKYAECMRSHGVNVPDPSANGGPPGGGGGGATGGGGGGGAFAQLRNSPNFASASKACASLRSKSFGFASISPAQRAQFQQDAVKFAECMRAHNIDIPDPSSNGTGGFGIFKDLRGSSETNSPAFKTAFTACSSNLPNGGHFGRGGTSTNSVGGPGA